MFNNLLAYSACLFAFKKFAYNFGDTFLFLVVKYLTTFVSNWGTVGGSTVIGCQENVS